MEVVKCKKYYLELEKFQAKSLKFKPVYGSPVFLYFTLNFKEENIEKFLRWIHFLMIHCRPNVNFLIRKLAKLKNRLNTKYSRILYYTIINTNYEINYRLNFITDLDTIQRDAEIKQIDIPDVNLFYEAKFTKGFYFYISFGSEQIAEYEYGGRLISELRKEKRERLKKECDRFVAIRTKTEVIPEQKEIVVFVPFE